MCDVMKNFNKALTLMAESNLGEFEFLIQSGFIDINFHTDKVLRNPITDEQLEDFDAYLPIVGKIMDEVLDEYKLHDYVSFFLKNASNMIMVKGVGNDFYEDVITFLTETSDEDIYKFVILTNERMNKIALIELGLDEIITDYTTIDETQFYFNVVNDHRVKYLKLMGLENENMNSGDVVKIMNSTDKKKEMSSYLNRHCKFLKLALFQFKSVS